VSFLRNSSHSTSEEVLWNLKVYYHVHKSPVYTFPPDYPEFFKDKYDKEKHRNSVCASKEVGLEVNTSICPVLVQSSFMFYPTLPCLES
jgi:hypothetical protein